MRLAICFMALLASPLVSLEAAVERANSDEARVRVESGMLLGIREGDIKIFKNIPYAAPPVGALRWKPPQSPAKWEETRPATEFGPACPFIDGAKMAQGQRLSGAYDIFIGVPLTAGSSEDCLHLNVWAPVNAKRAAVMVWIQALGGSSLPFFDGSVFAREGVVFVTLDYRQLTTGNFAHPALTKEAKPNEALIRFQTMDQIAALRWVKKNIAAFGGDPSNVTVFGESASAASVLQMLSIPDARGLIGKAIVQSGVGWWSPFTLSQMEQLGSWMATYAGLAGKDATAEQLRALPADALPQLGIYSIDGRLQPESGTTAIAQGHLTDVPLLIGWTDFDGSSLRSSSAEAYAAKAPASVKAAYSSQGKTEADLGYEMYTDNHVAAPARWIATQASSGAPSYLYLFSYVRAAKRGKVRGAAHGDDMFLIFDAWDKVDPRTSLTDEDRAAARIIRSCWVSFAKTGKPKCEGAPAWPRYTRKDDRLMELGTTLEIRKNVRREQLDAQEAAMQQTIDEAAKSVDDLLHRVNEGQMPQPK